MVPINDIVYPQWAVGFERPFVERIGVRFATDRVVEVIGRSEEAVILRDMLIGSRLIELGCGFNPKWPRPTIYPAGSNAPGVLHYGLDLAKPSDYIKKTMPSWEEPPDPHESGRLRCDRNRRREQADLGWFSRSASRS
ncbi:MAG: hypothetical protein ACKVQU_04310 [Burkholderiales bacterium]